MHDMSLEQPEIHDYAGNTVQHEPPQKYADGQQYLIGKHTYPEVLVKKDIQKKADRKNNKKRKLYEFKSFITFEIVVSHSNNPDKHYKQQAKPLYTLYYKM